MGGKLLHIKHAQALRSQQALHRVKRPIGVMFMIDRIELYAIHKGQQMRRFNGDHTTWPGQMREACGEIHHIRHMR